MKRRDDPDDLDPQPLRDNGRNSLELAWGSRRLRAHGLIAIVAFFGVLAVIGVPLYAAWYATSAPESADASRGAATKLADITDRQHREIIMSITRSNEEMVYTQLLTDREKAELRRRLAVPKRFRESGGRE